LGQASVAFLSSETNAFHMLMKPEMEVVYCQSLSLLGQDRSAKPKLADVLRAVGLGTGDSIAIVGWKYLQPEEWDSETQPGSFVRAYMVAVLKRIVGNSGVVTDETAVLMHPEAGLRATVDADQIAAFEWAAARSSAALWRVITGIRSGDSELKAAGRMRYAGEPLNVHTMLASGGSGYKISGPSQSNGTPSAMGRRRGRGHRDVGWPFCARWPARGGRRCFSQDGFRLLRRPDCLVRQR
jgi:hypothetical protein